eukprot:6175502-Pleurochrysis_carterae.AAC.2
MLDPNDPFSRMVNQSRQREKINQNSPFCTMDDFWTIRSGERSFGAVLYIRNARASLLGNEPLVTGYSAEWFVTHIGSVGARLILEKSNGQFWPTFSRSPDWSSILENGSFQTWGTTYMHMLGPVWMSFQGSELARVGDLTSRHRPVGVSTDPSRWGICGSEI